MGNARLTEVASLYIVDAHKVDVPTGFSDMLVSLVVHSISIDTLWSVYSYIIIPTNSDDMSEVCLDYEL